jgi:hypothetical protein
VVGAERRHVGGQQRRASAGQYRHVRVDQAGGDGDAQVGLFVVGEREHAAALVVTQSGQQQVVRQARIGGQRRGIGLEVDEIELLHAQLVLFEDHELAAEVVERLADQAARFARAADQIEGFAHVPHAAGEAAGHQGILESLVLEQRQDGQDRVRPADDGQVNGNDHPEPLRIREGARDFAEADGGRRVADEVEGMEEAHRRRRLAVGVHAGNQGQAQDRDRVDGDQDDQRHPHAPQDLEEDAVHALSRVSGASSRFRR